MGTWRKILLYVCLIVFIFVLGMMVRRFYDNYVNDKPLVETATMHRVVEPATELPAGIMAKTGQTQPSSLRPPEKKDE